MSSHKSKPLNSGYPPSCSEEYLQNILSSLNSKHANELHASIWYLNELTIDFSSIALLAKNHAEIFRPIQLDLVVFSKTLLLTSLNKVKSASIIRYKFDSILKTLFFLAKNHNLRINSKLYEEYIEFILMNKTDGYQSTRQLVPQSYSIYKLRISPNDWSKCLKLYQLPSVGFTDNFANSFMIRSEKNVIDRLSDGDLGYGDWKLGGSLNRLTLDYGRYYTDHCCTYFEQHIDLAIAFRNTLTQVSDMVKEKGVATKKEKLRTHVMLTIGHFLAGKTCRQLSKAQLYKAPLDWFEWLEELTKKTLEVNLKKLSVLKLLTSPDYLKLIAENSHFNLTNEDRRECLKQIISIRLTHLTMDDNAELCALRKSELEGFYSLVNKVTIDKINTCIDVEFRKLIKKVEVEMPTPDFFSRIGVVEKGSQSKYVNNFIRFVQSAGLVKFLSLTGWRESEYGFGIANIACNSNLDILDQYANPVRYEINWIVPKTNGSTQLKREITYGAYLTALQLSVLSQAESTSPCLFPFEGSKTSLDKPRSVVSRLIATLWENFVIDYGPFKKISLIDELKVLRQKSILNNIELNRVNEINTLMTLEEMEYLDSDVNLRQARDRANLELERVKFLLEPDSRRYSVWLYKTGELNREHTDLFDKYLSTDSKIALSNKDTEHQINPVFSREITNEIIQDCLYPTPHAFRHMWAEAVYRRFDGDVGWMIRSNFKHISAQMWLDYVRNKGNRTMHNQVKRTVISSLLNNYILQKGIGFAGPLDKLLRRLIKITHVATPEQVVDFVDQFSANEIEDIKSNPWGFCLLKKRNKFNAKCSEDGVPQRHNASPALCLGCNNNLTQSGNIEGIVLGVSKDMKVLRTIGMPEGFVRESYRTVSNALKQLKKLQADRDLLNEIEECLMFNKGSI